MKENLKKCELLAPAGGMEQYVAAVENGADAIYLGGKKYNARIGASNFDIDEIERVADLGHIHNVKTYVTMNTLLQDNELLAALKYVSELYKIGVDGLIIQDLGLGKIVREYFPDFPIHLSTQATVYNREGLEAAKKLGYERAVLARELSLEEIKACNRPNIIETEVFIHGALCMCYSGQCHLSRYIGGRSGNKGKCAQPCRLNYFDQAGKQGYYLSPKDLWMIKQIGPLLDTGVSSLKIEGRMKSPQYVATVVSIYRKYMDLYYAEKSTEVHEDDLESLKQIFNRGGFTEGYAYGNPGEGLMSGKISKNQGIYLGKLSAPKEKDKRNLLWDIRTDKELCYGDVVEIHGKNSLTSQTITYIKEKGKGLFTIGDIKEKVNPGDDVYRIISSSQMKKAQASYEKALNDNHLSTNPTPIDMYLKLEKTKNPLFKAVFKDKDGKYIGEYEYILQDYQVETAKSKKASLEDIEKQMRKTGNTPFVIEGLKVDLEDNIFIPVGKLNQGRRIVLENLEDIVKKKYKRALKSNAFNEYIEGEKLSFEKDLELFFYTLKSFEEFIQGKAVNELINSMNLKAKSNSSIKGVTLLLPVMDFVESMSSIEDGRKRLSDELGISVRIAPYILNVSKGNLDEWLRENYEKIIACVKAQESFIYVGNIAFIDMFSRGGARVRGDFGLNIYNNESYKAYETLGMSGFFPSLEASDQNIGFKALGRLPLMITEHHIDKKGLIDRKNKTYHIQNLEKEEKSLVLSETEDGIFEESLSLVEKEGFLVRVFI